MQTVEIIYLRQKTQNVILSKKNYSSWQEIQAEYDDYKTSIGPRTKEQILLTFEDDFNNEAEWPFSRKEIEDFFSGGDEVLINKV